MEENGKRRKKGRSFLDNFAKENGKMSSPICCARCGFFFSARLNRMVKNVKNGRPFFKFFFRENFFIKKSNNEESEHNEKTHKERTKQEEEEGKRKSTENQLLFRSGFFLTEKRDKEDIFQKEFENTDKWQNVF